MRLRASYNYVVNGDCKPTYIQLGKHVVPLLSNIPQAPNEALLKHA